MIACDTGFFVEYLKANSQATILLGRADVHNKPIVSVISLFELRKLALKGVTDSEKTDALLALIPKICQVVYLDSGSDLLIERAARLAHGNGLSMADSLIFASALECGADMLYTTDSDMLRYQGKEGPKVVNLRQAQ